MDDYKPSLRKIHQLTLSVSATVAILNFLFLYFSSDLSNWILLSLILKLICWFCIASNSSFIHSPKYYAKGSHYSLVQIIFLLMISYLLDIHSYLISIPIIWNSIQIVSVIQASVYFIYFMILGMWSDRDSYLDDDQVTLEKDSCVFSLLFISWINPLLNIATKKSLEWSEMWNLKDSDRADLVIAYYESISKREDTITWNLARTFRFEILFLLACATVNSVLSFSGPYFLYRIVKSIQEGTKDHLEIYLELGGMFLCSTIQAVIDGQMYYNGRVIGTRIRNILVSVIYKKSLQRVQHSSDPTNASSGKVVNLMSVDGERIRMFLRQLPEVVAMVPISIGIAMGSLFLLLGWSAMVGIVLIIIIGPLSRYIGKYVLLYQETLLKCTDSRISIINELLQGISVVKYFAWEPYFCQKINDARKKELHAIWSLWGAKIGFNVIGSGSGIVIAFVTFTVYTLVAGQSLNAAVAFTSINLLNVVSDLISSLPDRIMQILKAKISMERVQLFLNEKNIQRFSDVDRTVVVESSDSDAESLGMKNATFVYYGSKISLDSFRLKNLTVEFPIGKLTIICGATGSGKSTLLLALLGEMSQVSGSCFIPQSILRSREHLTNTSQGISYAAQTPWLINASIRDNILFGLPYDSARYQATIEATALIKDFEALEDGDLTEVGERGINLSGGQKQRISLARACYTSSSLVLLDDPLSAVDAPTAQYLLHKCILGILKGRTVILVTHATRLTFPYADFVVCMREGEIINSGTPSEVVGNTDDDNLHDIDLNIKQKEVVDDIDLALLNITPDEGTPKQLVQAEKRAIGKVDIRVYWTYLSNAGGIWFIGMFLFGFLSFSTAQVVNDWWLKQWTDHNVQNPQQSVDVNDSIHYISLYALFGLLVILASNVRTFISYVGSYKASQSLHAKLVNSTIHSPMRFFETTSIGTILNRFSKDIETLDTSIMDTIEGFFKRLITTGTVFVVIGVITPIFLGFAIVIMIVYIYIANLYLPASRDLKRLEAISQSPIYSQFSETLVGVTTIRAFHSEPRFIARMEFNLDRNHKPFIYLWAANRWLCLRTDIISAMTVFIAGMLVVSTGVDAGFAAMAITYCFQLTTALHWMVRLHAEMEMGMNSVERLLEYTDLTQEDTLLKNDIPDDWPQRGCIKVKQLTVRYSPELQDILHGISFEINSGEKVAVVGRTGAGKTTLSAAFFRMVPIGNNSILIDGEDINNIDLCKLRSCLTIIPQNPVLFKGSIRSNLDPFNIYDDHVIWEVLKSVNFGESLQSNVTDLLDLNVSENGGNFSLGQKQLLCLARALLRGNKIVILDEATASVDDFTDDQIQTAIRNEFKNTTIICIAHRLKTVIDYDKIIVLENGKLIEFGTPYDLLHNPGVGTFRSMCVETGEFDELMNSVTKNRNKD
ncbi:P-loop containing nucleoside triphosphate hydrolase protein [Globomyces pollinis-pini]|nr:P-loop containing nucleoside triphosphate hydrolase protein [Globomyces pollinis-pini]